MGKRGLVAAVFSVPVAGTALTIMDPYVTARTLSTPATMLALAAFVTNRPRITVIWLVVTAFLHPQMCVYGTAFVFCAALVRRKREVPRTAYALATLGPILDFEPVQGPAREALLSRTYFFVSNWTLYEWMGVFAPVALLFWASKLELRGTTRIFRI